MAFGLVVMVLLHVSVANAKRGEAQPFSRPANGCERRLMDAGYSILPSLAGGPVRNKNQFFSTKVKNGRLFSEIFPEIDLHGGPGFRAASIVYTEAKITVYFASEHFYVAVGGREVAFFNSPSKRVAYSRGPNGEMEITVQLENGEQPTREFIFSLAPAKAKKGCRILEVYVRNFQYSNRHTGTPGMEHTKVLGAARRLIWTSRSDTAPFWESEPPATEPFGS